MTTLYRDIATELAKHIDENVYRVGERMPGVRSLATRRGASVATIVAAYRLLEDEGRLEARSRSGFYVCPRRRPAAEPRIDQGAMRPRMVTGQDMAMALLGAAQDPAVIKLGAAVPAPEFLPVRAVATALSRASRAEPELASNYMTPPGLPELRRQIARRMNEAGASVRPQDVVITTGCQEALALALRAVTQPGDTVAVESPAFYGLLHVMESLGLKALEIPSHPREGIALDRLRTALEKWKVKACIASPNFSNPLGFRMSDEHKRALVGILARRGIPLIEDDVYGDLGYEPRRPSTCKGLMPEADILYCSSFSKSLSPGLRIGWVVAGQHQARVEYLKYVSSLATPTAPQMAAAEMLKNGHYSRHVRAVRGRYATQVARFRDTILTCFPEGTRISKPQGGFVLWVELGEKVDAFDLARRALKQGISIAPGPLFSASGRYRNCFRVSCGATWDARVERALVTLAKLV